MTNQPFVTPRDHCGRCRHFLRRSANTAVETNDIFGTCHRHAPSHFPGPRDGCNWPPVCASDFCGEFDARELPLRPAAAKLRTFDDYCKLLPFRCRQIFLHLDITSFSDLDNTTDQQLRAAPHCADLTARFIRDLRSLFP